MSSYFEPQVPIPLTTSTSLLSPLPPSLSLSYAYVMTVMHSTFMTNLQKEGSKTFKKLILKGEELQLTDSGLVVAPKEVVRSEGR